jgi:hypothetical protein
MGIGTMMDESRNIVRIVTGVQKAAALCACVEGAVTHLFPSSILQMHPDVWVVCDDAATLDLKGPPPHRKLCSTHSVLSRSMYHAAMGICSYYFGIPVRTVKYFTSSEITRVTPGYSIGDGTSGGHKRKR